MICLGIESTAHTFGIGIVEDVKILASAKDMYTAEKGGIHPREAADHHVEVCGTLLKKVFEESGKTMKDVDVVAFSRGPGLPPCLRVGAAFARQIAQQYSKPLIDVNHCVAHIEIGKAMTGAKDPVTLYVSGGNTQVIAFAEGRYRVFGETLDDAIGNALDTFARKVGLPEPGGPVVERLAKSGKYVELPYVVKGMNLSFSGILTEAVKRFKNGTPLEDICYSLQEIAFAMLIEVTERAIAHTGKDEVMITGGVAANRRFVEMLEIMSKERGVKVFSVAMQYAGDNGAMIGIAGLLDFKAGRSVPVEKSRVDSRWRTDQVVCKWV